MRLALALCALTGCTQIFGLSDPVRETSGDAPLADVAGDSGAADTAVVAPGNCDPSMTSLIACYDFEGNTLDGSSTANHATGSNVLYGQGIHGQAIRVSATSMVSAPSANVLNVVSFSMEAWVRLESMPAVGGRAGVFDADGRYGIYIHPDGSFATRSTLTPVGLVQVAQWCHLAVTDDGTTRLFYFNGSLVAAQTSTAVPMSTSSVEIGGNAPSGDRLLGAIDLVRVYSSILSPQQIFFDAML